MGPRRRRSLYKAKSSPESHFSLFHLHRVCLIYSNNTPCTRATNLRHTSHLAVWQVWQPPCPPPHPQPYYPPSRARHAPFAPGACRSRSARTAWEKQARGRKGAGDAPPDDGHGSGDGGWFPSPPGQRLSSLGLAPRPMVGPVFDFSFARPVHSGLISLL